MRTLPTRWPRALSVIAATAVAVASFFILNPLNASAAPSGPAAHAQTAVQAGDPIRYEAEESPATCDGTIDSNHAGYSGTGFCNTPNTTGAASQFTVTADSAGEATVAIGFANGSSGGARGADVVVNGATVTSTLFEVTGAWSDWSTKTVTVPLNQGDNTIGLIATDSGGLPNIDYLDHATPPPPAVRYEAEDAPAVCDGTIESNHAGYSGTGFCDTPNTTGTATQFTVTADSAGEETVKIRFANGSSGGARGADVVVDGATVTSTSFEVTGAWSDWSTKTVAVPLNQGDNTVRLVATDSGGLPNIDYLEVGGPDDDGSTWDPNLQYYGRWATDGDWRTMGWAGGYVETAFTGSSIGVRLRGTIDIYYSVDGAPERWRRGASGDVTVASGLGNGPHTIRIGFRERAGGYTGDPAFGGFNLASGGQTTSIDRPADFIEFIGDSITVGWPNDDRPFTTYPYLVGEALGAGHTQVAQSGACLVEQDCYGMVDWFRRSSAWVDHDDWDFSTYQADAVVINLGTNDADHGVSSSRFYQDYILLLERIRQVYPDAHIFAMGVFRNQYVTETRNAVQVRIDAGDAKVHFVDTSGWIDPARDTSDYVHPTDAGNQKIADRLIPIIDQYL